MKRREDMHTVFILESEGAHDLVRRRSEGEGLERLLRLMNYECVHKRADCKAAFFNQLAIFTRSECNVLHISCHGNDKGIGLTNGDFVTWAELYAQLRKGECPFMLNLSSCEATGQDELVELFKASGNRPFMISGSPEPLTWDEAFLAWGMFYRAHTSVPENNYDVMCNTMASIQLGLERRFRATWFTTKKDDEGNDTLDVSCFDSILLLDAFKHFHVELGRQAAGDVELKPEPSAADQQHSESEAPDAGSNEQVPAS